MASSPPPFTPPRTEEDILSWLRLIRSRRIGPGSFRRLLRDHGTAAAALQALPEVARAAGIAGYAPCPPGVAAAEMAAARAAGAFPLCLGDPRYPAALAAIADAPPFLWARGDPGLLARPAVALVGARNASSLGLRMARMLAAGLGAEGFVVVSGLARGIDAAAHEAALSGGTVAVLAGGIDAVYPAENAPLAARIAAAGLLLSEAPMGLQPQARDFPRRNRIVAGLSLGVVVVEAATRSGSLITAGDALEQGREVMAVPGHPLDPRAGGCNALIREGATLVRGTADILAAVAGRPGVRAPAEPAAPPCGSPGSAGGPGAAAVPVAPDGADRVSAAAARPDGHAAPGKGAEAARTTALAEAILGRLAAAPLAEDQLIRDLALPAARVAPELMRLELDGRIARHPGGLLARGD